MKADCGKQDFLRQSLRPHTPMTHATKMGQNITSEEAVTLR